MRAHTRAGRMVTVVTTYALLLQSSTPLIGAGAQTSTRPPVPPPTAPAQPAKPAPAAAVKPPATAAVDPAPVPVDGGWPRMYSLASGGNILVYQPQIASWDRQTHLVAFSAVSYRSKGGDKPSMGTIKLEATTRVAVPERLVSFQDMKIAETNFPGVAKEQVREVADQVASAMPHEERVIALDRVLASLDKSQIVAKNVEGIKADPPTIFYSKTAAAIVNVDGEPIWSPIKENDLKYAVNTNWDLFQHVPTNTYYLRNEASWLKAANVSGPWSPAGTLPASFKILPPDDNW